MDDPQLKVDRWLFLNDWPLHRHNVVVLGFLLCLTSLLIGRALVGESSFFNYLGYLIVPFLMFIPGVILLRVMRVHGLDFSRSMMYALPLGVAFIMGLGFALNLLHYTGLVDDPLSFNVIAIAYPLSILGLLILAIRRDQDYVAPDVHHALDPKLVLMAILSFAIPFLVICAAVIADFDGPRSFMFYVLLAICLTPLLLLSHRTKHYEFIILGLSLALLFQKALLTNYLQGYDIFSELSAATVTTNVGWWDVLGFSSQLGAGANTALSIVVLTPMLSHLTSIMPMEMLKIVYPFIFAFVPLMLYKIIEGQFNSKVAVLGCILFISYSGFFMLMTQLGKQEIAELFLVASVLVLLDVSLPRGTKRLLFVIFLVGVVVSHYSLAYMLMPILAGLIVLQTTALIYRSWKGREKGQGTSFTKWLRGTGRTWLRTEGHERILTLDILIIIAVLFFVWYSVTASGAMLNAIDSGQGYVGAAGSGAVPLRTMEAIEYLLIDYGSILHNMEKFFVVGTQIITIFGVVFLLVFRKEGGSRLKDEFLFLGIGGAGILIAAYVVPNLSLSFYFGRFFQFTLIFLCGFLAIGIYGFFFLIREIRKGFGRERSGKQWDLKKLSFVTGVAMMSLFLMFNTSVIYAIAGGYGNSFALDSSVSGSIYSDSDVTAAFYLCNDTHSQGSPIMADYHHFPIIAGQGCYVKNLPYQIHQDDTNNIVYLTSWNIEYGYTYALNTNGSATLSYVPLNEVFKQLNGSYDVMYSSSGKSTAIYIPSYPPPNTNPVGPPIVTYEDSPIYVIPTMVLVVSSVLLLGLIARFNYNRRMLKKKGE